MTRQAYRAATALVVAAFACGRTPATNSSPTPATSTSTSAATALRRISGGTGKTTCGYFFDNDRKLFFASTHAHGAACPVRPDPSQGYVWGLDKFDIYTVDRDGTNLQRLTRENIYTAEATL